MPKTLMHDTGRGAELKRRVQALTPDTKQRWGKMSVDQMLHHVNFVLAESLGAVESLIELPGPMTHASVSGSPLEVPANLIRLSVGLEHPEDLIADLARALGP